MVSGRPDQALFESLLHDVHQARGRWRKDPVAIFAARAGRLATGELMLVGRALNGGSCRACLDDIGTPAGRAAVVASAFHDAAGATKDPMQWVLDCWGARGTLYNTRRSQFWRTAKSCVERLGLVGDPAAWPFVISWSDLYKVSPAKRGNPPATLMRAQRASCVQILRAEIDHWKPKRILFLTGINWARPFLAALPLESRPAMNAPVEFVGVSDDRCQVVVTPHPQIQSGKRLVDAIVEEFKTLEATSPH